MKTRQHAGFALPDALMLVLVIVLLLAILAPTIAGTQSSAMLTVSLQNLATLSKAYNAYGADWNDRQPTAIVDDFSTYGTSGETAVTNYAIVTGHPHPPLIYGNCNGGVWGLYFPGSGGGTPSNQRSIVPLDFSSKFGNFRIPNGKHFSSYLNGRFFDPVFYAPNDEAAYAVVEPWLTHPCEYSSSTATGGNRWSSYCTSPAAMFNPAVLSLNLATARYYKSPFSIPNGFASPSFSQATFPALKTQVLEHHWNQNPPSGEPGTFTVNGRCNPAFGAGSWAGCEPYYFNHGMASAPATLFYDGSVRLFGNTEAIDANRLVDTQTPGSNNGLWSVDTPLGGGYNDYSTGGYYMEMSWDWASTSHHILTINGIQGRDTIAN